jgi:hypothetical protein
VSPVLQKRKEKTREKKLKKKSAKAKAAATGGTASAKEGADEGSDSDDSDDAEGPQAGNDGSAGIEEKHNDSAAGDNVSYLCKALECVFAPLCLMMYRKTQLISGGCACSYHRVAASCRSPMRRAV